MSALPPFAIGWGLGAGLGAAALVWLMQRAGFDRRQMAIVVTLLTAAVLIGSKLLYLAESWPSWWSGPATPAEALFSPHMRIPGGILMAILVGPLIARAIGVAFLAYADVAAPAAGVLLAGVRIGCLLQGCCFGTRSHLPFAVRFPAGSDAHAWQVGATLIHPHTPWSEPVHALQIYFALAGVALFVLLALRQRRPRFPGEILLLLGVGYFWTTWALEFFRQVPHAFSQSLALVVAVVLTLVYVTVRRGTAV